MLDVITDHIDIWTSAQKKKSAVGRGSSSKLELYGIKKLRELILDLAVHGKLVPQDPNDEPASELLKKIAAEKEGLVKEGKIKNQKTLPPIDDNEKPYEVPQSWEWIRLGEIGLTQTGSTPKNVDIHHYGSFLPFIKPGDILNGQITSYNNDGLSEEGATSLDRVTPSDSVLMVCIGTIGKCARSDRDVSFNQQINSVSPFLKIGKYVEKVLQSAYFQRLAWESSSSTTIAILNKGKWEQIPFVLAPEVEQHRIVSKVNELMVLCDQLEQEEIDNKDAHQTLVKTLLNTLTSVETAEEFTQSWQRISEHFDILFTTEESIEELKQTILQLAVMGKLVPQNPNDEPASELLKKIEEEKDRLVKEKKIKEPISLVFITEDEKPYSIPANWEFTRFGNITNRIGSGSTPRGGESAYKNEGITFLRSQNIYNDGLKLEDVVYISEETHEKMNHTKVMPGDILLNITGGSLGRSTIYPQDIGEANVSQHVTIIRPTIPSTNQYLHYCILSPYIQGLIWGRQVGMAREGLSKKVLELFEIPLPPLNEQYRIVRKVDELMALCDSLKTKICEAKETQVLLADAIVQIKAEG